MSIHDEIDYILNQNNDGKIICFRSEHIQMMLEIVLEFIESHEDCHKYNGMHIAEAEIIRDELKKVYYGEDKR